MLIICNTLHWNISLITDRNIEFTLKSWTQQSDLCCDLLHPILKIVLFSPTPLFTLLYTLSLTNPPI